MSDKLNELIKKFKVDEKDLTHYSLDNPGGNKDINSTDKERKASNNDDSSIIAAMQASV